MSITEKQQKFLDYLKDNLTTEGKAPSLRQAAHDLGVSHNAIAQFFTQLEKKGIIERDGRYSRKIHLYPNKISQEQETVQVKRLPIIGQITAGLPIYAQQEWDGTVIVDPSLFPGDNLFCLRIKGQSMRDAGILDGDLVICEPRQYAESGEIVVALIHSEEATVKRFQLHSDHIELQPENRDFSSVKYGFNELMVQGKIIGVVRDNIIQ